MTENPRSPADLSQLPADAIRIPGKSLRRYIYVILSLLTAVSGVYIMFDILSANQLNTLEAIILVLFGISFSWLSLAFWSGVFGFVLQMLRIDPLSLKSTKGLAPDNAPITTRTAVVMPVYNEDTHRVIAGFEATLRSLENTGEIANFDFFLLSDTTNLTIAQAERDAWQLLQERLGDLGKQAFYRRREKNIGRKVGNLAEFCQRWGANYEHMIVLDADSVMAGDCLLKMVRAMQANPRCGLIQTIPIPVRQTTFFGRFVQYAAVLYSPMLATGLAFWQTDAANYWGHNAIIRMRAFIDHCGLPTLAGKAPFGGDILSHDFVEAAMLRRAQWDVFLLADLEGSYEEVPCNIIDYAKRDRRWVQGNIQHLGILDTKDLHPISRLHFLLGAVAYITSLIWMLMLVLSTADAVVRAINANVYFTEAHQLYPNWPIAKTELIIALIVLTTVLLMGPKLLGVIVTLTHRRTQFGGTWAILKSTFLETLFAVLIAPIMMVYHAYFVISVLLGFKVNWDSQEREGRLLPWGECIARTSKMTFAALLWGYVTYTYAPIFFWWLLPVLTGLVLSAPLVRYSSSLDWGRGARERKIFLTPNETSEDPVLTHMNQLLTVEHASLPSPAPIPALPADNWTPMPHRDMDDYQTITR
ncbi:glucan biosynthesis glucosyltransferase H [Cellvibrio mixtus]|jgi:membrane glycosyltransferase|uniref:Glucans biosynthesis glucosyltransferase H n=1 Tax=Cellvibrio mixtus TaxID=39650 RepID=A0A266QCL3_9GAMM|nr:glucans biosynthesis glucosyltransferase MdoH [Cellvibrio mixtus]OZY87081.1 glucan biosynthesis glucosyltransferase H [Cellvibrio mixtus]